MVTHFNTNQSVRRLTLSEIKFLLQSSQRLRQQPFLHVQWRTGWKTPDRPLPWAEYSAAPVQHASSHKEPYEISESIIIVSSTRSYKPLWRSKPNQTAISPLSGTLGPEGPPWLQVQFQQSISWENSPSNAIISMPRTTLLQRHQSSGQNPLFQSRSWISIMTSWVHGWVQVRYPVSVARDNAIQQLCPNFRNPSLDGEMRHRASEKQAWLAIQA